MSYILDALRKSDQQRQRGAVATTLTAQAPQLAPRRPVVSLNALLAVVLVGAGIVIGWLRPWQPGQADPAAQAVAVKPPAASPLLAAPAPLPLVREMAGKAKQEPPPQKAASAAQSAYPSGGAVAKPDAPALARAEPPKTRSTAVAGVPRDAARPMPEKPLETNPADAAPGQSAMALSELPASIQQEIPRLSISLHSYASNPRDRFVMINNTMLRQGEFLAPGLRLEQITLDGVIISYQGYRFHHGVR